MLACHFNNFQMIDYRCNAILYAVHEFGTDFYNVTNLKGDMPIYRIVYPVGIER